MTSLKASLPKQLETDRLILEFWNQSPEHYAAVISAFAGDLKSNSDVDALFDSIAFSGATVILGREADTALICVPRLKSTKEHIGCILICQEPHYIDIPTTGWLIQERF